MSRIIHVFSVSGYNFNLTKSKVDGRNKWYEVSYLHKNAASHDELAINRLKMLFQKDGILFEQSCAEIPNSNNISVQAHLIFFADRAFDFKKSKAIKGMPDELGRAIPGITLSFTGAQLHKGELIIPDDLSLRRFAVLSASPKPTALGIQDIASMTVALAKRRATLAQKIVSQYKMQISACEFTQGKTSVGLEHYYFKPEYARLFNRRKETTNYPRQFGGFLYLFNDIYEVNQPRGGFSKLQSRFVNELRDHIASGRLEEAQSVVSIADIYRALNTIASLKHVVLELSIFSHAWQGGPVLVNSNDKRDEGMRDAWFAYDKNAKLPSAFAKSMSEQEYLLAESRSPYDKDARTRYDFIDTIDRVHIWTKKHFSNLEKIQNTLNDEHVRWYAQRFMYHMGDVVAQNQQASTAFRAHSRVLFWGCNAVKADRLLLSILLKSDKRSKNAKAPNKQATKTRLRHYWSQKLGFALSMGDDFTIGNIDYDVAAGIKAHTKHKEAFKRESTPVVASYQTPLSLPTSPLGLRGGFSAPLDALTEEREDDSADQAFDLHVRPSETLALYGLDALPKIENLESLSGDASFKEALRMFGPFAEDSNPLKSNVSLSKYWQRLILDSKSDEGYLDFTQPTSPWSDEAQMRKIFKAIERRCRASWSVRLAPSLIAERLSIDEAYNWRAAFAWGVKVHAAPPGVGSVFQRERSDAMFKKRKQTAAKRKVPKQFFPLNELSATYKRYGDYKAPDSRPYFHACRELFAFDTAEDALLEETSGYLIFDPKDTSFWNVIPWPAVRDVLRLDWLERAK